MAAGKRKLNNGEIAAAFVQRDEYIRDLVYCIQYNSFYLYNKGYYKRLEDDEIQRTIYKFLRMEHPTVAVTANIVKDVVKLISWECYRRVDDTDHAHIAFNDCLFNLNTFTTKQFNRDIITTYHVDCDYKDIEMDTPVFTNFLQTSLVDKANHKLPDNDLINLVQQMFGFIIIENLKAGAAFFLVGNGANGKSVMATILQNMVGSEYCSAMSIQTLTTDKFSTHHLIGKKLNISNEEESKYIRSDKFKALITGEMVSAQKKFGDSFEFLPRTKYVFATNQIPTFEGLNYGIRRRLHIIPFFREFKPEEMDHSLLAGEGKLGSKLKAELPGIINWAIDGAKQLVKNNYKFITTTSSQEALREFENEISSAVRFIREEYEVDSDSFIDNSTLYSDYKVWCDNVGKKPMNKYNFERDCMNTIEGLESIQKRNVIENKPQRGRNLRRINQSDLDNFKF